MNPFRIRLSCLVPALLVLWSSCSNRELSFSSFAGFTQGTTYSIIFRDDGKINPDTLEKEVGRTLLGFDMSLSIYRDSSVVSMINRNEEVMPDNYFYEVFTRSKEINKLTGGAFDVTVGPLVNAWGFGPDSRRVFTEEKRDSLIRLVGMDKVELKSGRLFKALPEVTLDFNGIAQGYAVDVVWKLLDSKGIKSFLVEIGGEVRVKGDKNGLGWRIGIDRPEDLNMMPGQNLQAVITIKDRSLATSGNYRKFFIEDGVKYSHTIDPVTGYPARNRLLSATILAHDCMTADAIATACMVMGLEKAVEFVNADPSLDAYFVYSDESGNFRTWFTEKLRQQISENTP